MNRYDPSRAAGLLPLFVGDRRLRLFLAFCLFRNGLLSLFVVAWPPPLTPTTYLIPITIRTMLPLFLLFTVIPLVELWLLFQLSGVFGFWTTIAVVLATGALGAALARWQGWRALQRVQTEMRQGILPAQTLGDGVLILVAGVLLITPGVLTDVLGLSLLVPPVRAGVRKGLQLWLAKHVRVDTTAAWQTHQQDSPSTDGDIVEGKVVDSHVVED